MLVVFAGLAAGLLIWWTSRPSYNPGIKTVRTVPQGTTDSLPGAAKSSDETIPEQTEVRFGKADDGKPQKLANQAEVLATIKKWDVPPQDSGQTNTGNSPSRPRLAVLYFEKSGSETKELDALQKGLWSMLIASLSKSDLYDVVEREQLKQIIEEQKISNSTLFDPASAAKLGRLVGAQYLVFGSYFTFSGSLRVDARLVDVETGRTVVAAGKNGNASDLGGIVDAISSEMVTSHARKLGNISP